jgi:hypothetical protein
MPTGYTADINDGISFETYALNCARAFGACVTLRDERGGGEIIPDEFLPSDYYLVAAQKARNELAALNAMSSAELERAAFGAWTDAEIRRLMGLEEKRNLRIAYENMLAEVSAWTPPTPDHVGLREFMCSQIEESIKWDCNDGYYSTPTPKLSGSDWAAERRAKLEHDIQYHEEEYEKEVLRTTQRTEWIRALRNSLK